MRIIIFLLSLFFVVSCTNKKNEYFDCASINDEIGCEISFIRILTDPLNYNNEKITTTAYVVSEDGINYMVIDPNNIASMRLFGSIIVEIKELDPEGFIEGGLYVISGVFDYKSMRIKSAYASILPSLHLEESPILLNKP